MSVPEHGLPVTHIVYTIKPKAARVSVQAGSRKQEAAMDTVRLVPGSVTLKEWRAIYRGAGVTIDLACRPAVEAAAKVVEDIIAEGAPTSAILGISAMALALFVGSLLGVMAALRQNKAQDYLVMALAIGGVCLPPLVVGPVMQLLFGVQWQILPTQGLHRDQFGLIYLLLPVLTLSLPIIAIVSRLMRASMIEALRSNAIRTARAKGLPEQQVIWRHALPIAMLPIISYAGPALAGVMAGSFVIETVFSLPGIGKQFVLAAQQRDYTLVMGVVLIYSFLIILLNLAADLMYRVLDPRSRTA